jgi:hypothetical protein
MSTEQYKITFITLLSTDRSDFFHGWENMSCFCRLAQLWNVKTGCVRGLRCLPIWQSHCQRVGGQSLIQTRCI